MQNFSSGFFRYSFIVCLTALSSFQLNAQELDQLLNRADVSMDVGDWENAIANLTQIEKNDNFRTELGEQQYSETLTNLGASYLKIGNLEEARISLETALEIKKAIGDYSIESYGVTLEELGLVYIKLGLFDNAKVMIEEAVEIAAREKGRNSYEYAIAISELGEFYEEVGYYSMAFENFSKAHDIIEVIHEVNSPEYARICHHMGRILVKNGILSTAEEYLTQAVSVYEGLGDKYLLDYTSSMESLGVLYETEGKFAESEKILLKNLQIKRSSEGVSNEMIIETLNDLCILYQHLGNIEKSEFFFKQVYDLCIESLGKDHGYFGIATNNLGTIAKKKGEFDKAEELLLESIRVYEFTYGKKHPLYADALNNLASVEVSLKKYDLADSRYQEVLTIDREIYGTEHPLYATALSNYGILLFKKGDIKKAEEFYTEALNIRKNSLGVHHPSYANSLENLGLYYFVDEDLDQAEIFLREAVEILKEQITSLFPVMTENERALFYQTIRNDIERYNYVALQLIDQKPELAETILNNQIQTKAILLNTSERAKSQIVKNQNPEIINLYNNWVKEKDRLVRYYQIGKATLEENQIDLRKLEGRVEELEKDLMLKSSEFKEIVSSREQTWKDIQNVLGNDEAVVEIVKIRRFNTVQENEERGFGFLDDCFYVAIWFDNKSSKPELIVLEEGYNLDIVHYPYYSNALEYGLSDTDSYKYYWKEIDKNLKGYSNIYVAPDGIYHKINPNTFKTSSKEYLIDKYYISYVTNCSDLLKKENDEMALNRAYLFGNPEFNLDGVSTLVKPLPGAEREVKEISEIITAQSDWDSRLLTQAEANESRIRNVFSPKVLHIATHGFFEETNITYNLIDNSLNPLFKSGLFLSGIEDAYKNQKKGYRVDPTNDGMLTAYEAMNMNLQNTDLVILSACETGLGRIDNGEGVYGLQRAFIVAGAKSLIISHVKVQDEATEKMMEYFYDNYTKSGKIKASLKEAQLKLREEYPDPYVWGAFMLIGKG